MTYEQALEYEEYRDKSKKPVYWLGENKPTDDFGFIITDLKWDGKTNQGYWAIMTPEAFAIYGHAGIGQLYQLQPDGRWLKIKG